MTTAGKVFSVLSMLLGVGFLLLVPPVAKSLIDTQKQIVELENRQPALRDATASLDAQRVQLTYELNRLKDKLTAERTKFQNQADVVSGHLSLLVDMEKAELAGVRNWQETVKGITEEIQARREETDSLDAFIAEVTAARDERSAQLSDLRDRLTQASEQLESALAENQRLYSQLEQSITPPASSTSGALAQER